MANVHVFFENLENHYRKGLPFVVYSRPINSVIKCWLQQSNALYKTASYDESGFVFAPFDLKTAAIVFPEHDCDYKAVEIDKLDVEFSQVKSRYEPTIDKSAHVALVSKGLEEIQSGNLEKVVLSRVEIRPFEDENPIQIFKRLFNAYKNAMVYCWYHPKVGLWLGATPELLFKVVGQQLTTISLAGTQAVEEGKTPQWINKELEEQQIVTDYLVKQIQPFTSHTKISETESVKAGKLWHLKTRLISRIKAGAKLKSIIEALHPTPAVCGFPKEKAQQFILRNEGYPREYYTGFLGELNLKKSSNRNPNSRNIENNAYGTMKTISNFYVNLRCMQIKDGKVMVYVGGGVTKDSLPEREYEETQNKAMTISTILR